MRGRAPIALKFGMDGGLAWWELILTVEFQVCPAVSCPTNPSVKRNTTSVHTLAARFTPSPQFRRGTGASASALRNLKSYYFHPSRCRPDGLRVADIRNLVERRADGSSVADTMTFAGRPRVAARMSELALPSPQPDMVRLFESPRNMPHTS